MPPKTPLPTEEAGSIPVVGNETSAPETKNIPRSFLQAARRGLSEEELSTPAARRFLIAELERMDETCGEMKGFEKKYHDQRVEIATLIEAGKISRWNEILSFICLTVGAAGLGAAPGYLNVVGAEHYGQVFFGLSLILVLAGIASRIWK